MLRLIDADALPRHGRRGGLVNWKDIENAPTVDAVRHGRWIKERNPMMYQSYPYVWVCDQCGTAFYYKTPYCGECGAKMDEAEE